MKVTKIKRRGHKRMRSSPKPSRCLGLSGECPNPPDLDGYCWVHKEVSNGSPS